MTEFGRMVRRAGLFVSLFTVACGGQEHEEKVPIRNISDQALTMSSSPEETYANPKNLHYRGALPPGHVAIANCIDVIPGYPESTSVHVSYEGSEGYIDIYNGGGKYGVPVEPQLQVDLSVAALERRLDKC